MRTYYRLILNTHQWRGYDKQPSPHPNKDSSQEYDSTADHLPRTGKQVMGEVKSSVFFGYLNDLGREGWELVAVRPNGMSSTAFYHFKRPIE